MMTLAEIESARVNPDVAREAYDQAAKRLADTLDTKKAYEQKAFTLFNAFLTLSLALFGTGGALYKDWGLDYTILSIWITAGLLVAGASCFVMALMDEMYGAIASSPDMWLNPGTIDGDDTVLPRMLAYVTYYHQERIDTSTKANNRKADLIRSGIFIGLAAPLLIATLFVAQLFFTGPS